MHGDYCAGTRPGYFFVTGGGTGGVLSSETEQKASEKASISPSEKDVNV